ncbi:MAG: transglutaminase family protein, partial [Planctomycetota bacterium]
TGLKPGATLEVKTYLADLGGPVTLVVTVGNEEEVELLDGKKERLLRVETAIKGVPLKPVSWVDAAGRPKKTFVNAAGIPMETFAATEERARKAVASPTGPAPDVFENTLLAPKHPIPFPRRLDRATYRIRSKEEMPDFADGRQAVEQAGDGAVLLRIDRKVPPAGRTGTRPIEKPPADLATCLAANSMVQSDAPEIAAIVRDALAEERDAWKAAQTLERWVYENITDKNMDVGFASALEVCKNREGDCTEHAVLLCALCRAAGIPSRVAMGVVCIGNAFGGHAWTEVWIDGDWYALDGTLGHGSVDPTHITLGRMALEDNAGPEGFIGLLQGLGNLEIDPVEVVLEGRTLRPADAARIEGARYESGLWGLAFTCPKGFEFDPPSAKAGMRSRIMELDGKTGDGKGCEIEIEVTDAVVWDMVRGRKGVEEFKLDGRPALRGTEGGQRKVCVLAHGGAFLLELDTLDAAATAAFEEFLASVDFDAK